MAITEELWREKKRESDEFSFVVFSGKRQILYDPNYSIADLAVDKDKKFSVKSDGLFWQKQSDQFPVL